MEDVNMLWCCWQALKCTNPFTYTVQPVDLTGKNVLITGGNNGVGREAALQLAEWGANITLACREPPPNEIHPDKVVEECRQRGRADAIFEYWQCDMADLATVKAIGARWNKTMRPLDILLNNAGMTEQSRLILTKDGFEILHQVNFLAHTLLTMTVLPSLAKAQTPRIVCTTSCMQYFGKFDMSNSNSGKNAYSNNKLYFQIWLTELQRRCLQDERYKHISINGVHPGYVKTGIWHTEKTAKEMTWLGWLLRVSLDYIGIDAQQGSLAITYAATNPDCGLSPEQGGTDSRGRGGGRFFNRVWEEVPMPQTQDNAARLKVWDFVDAELQSTKLGTLHMN